MCHSTIHFYRKRNWVRTQQHPISDSVGPCSFWSPLTYWHVWCPSVQYTNAVLPVFSARHLLPQPRSPPPRPAPTDRIVQHQNREAAAKPERGVLNVLFRCDVPENEVVGPASGRERAPDQGNGRVSGSEEVSGVHSLNRERGDGGAPNHGRGICNSGRCQGNFLGTRQLLMQTGAALLPGTFVSKEEGKRPAPARACVKNASTRHCAQPQTGWVFGVGWHKMPG